MNDMETVVDNTTSDLDDKADEFCRSDQQEFWQGIQMHAEARLASIRQDIDNEDDRV